MLSCLVHSIESHRLDSVRGGSDTLVINRSSGSICVFVFFSGDEYNPFHYSTVCTPVVGVLELTGEW